MLVLLLVLVLERARYFEDEEEDEHEHEFWNLVPKLRLGTHFSPKLCFVRLARPPSPSCPFRRLGGVLRGWACAPAPHRRTPPPCEVQLRPDGIPKLRLGTRRGRTRAGCASRARTENAGLSSAKKSGRLIDEPTNRRTDEPTNCVRRENNRVDGCWVKHGQPAFHHETRKRIAMQD